MGCVTSIQQKIWPRLSTRAMLVMVMVVIMTVMTVSMMVLLLC